LKNRVEDNFMVKSKKEGYLFKKESLCWRTDYLFFLSLQWTSNNMAPPSILPGASAFKGKHQSMIDSIFRSYRYLCNSIFIFI
jgi:hypothetical protein